MQLLPWITSAGAGLARDLADVALSRVCIGCGREGPVLCSRCAARLPAAPSKREQSPVVWYSGEYEGLLRDLVLAHKERGVRALTPILGSCLALALSSADVQLQPHSLALDPIPAHRASIRSRGRDSLDEIARSAAWSLRQQGQACRVLRLIQWTREHDRQAGSTAKARRQLGDAFTVGRARPVRHSVVVVDDIITTGATASAAVNALTARGILVEAVACIASRGLRSR